MQKILRTPGRRFRKLIVCTLKVPGSGSKCTATCRLIQKSFSLENAMLDNIGNKALEPVPKAMIKGKIIIRDINEDKRLKETNR